MQPRIATIVEGYGEVEALPIVIRRILAEDNPANSASIRKPIRIPKGKLLLKGELEKAVDLASRKVAGMGAILVVVDSDGTPPCQLGPDLLRRARLARPDLPIGVVLAHREWEAWYLAAAHSIAGYRGLPAGLEPPSAPPESIPGAKDWLRKRMPAGRTYRETVDQPALASVFDLKAARTAPSFDKLCRDVIRLFLEASRR